MFAIFRYIMRFPTVLAPSVAASASLALVYVYNISHQSVCLTSRFSIATLPCLVHTMRFHVVSSRTSWISSPVTTTSSLISLLAARPSTHRNPPRLRPGLRPPPRSSQRDQGGDREAGFGERPIRISRRPSTPQTEQELKSGQVPGGS